MTYQVSCAADLGIEGCDFVATGDIPAEVLETLLPHLRSKHNLSMPDADAILSDNAWETPFVNGEAAGPVETVVRRLQRIFDVPDEPGMVSIEPGMTLGRLPNR